MATIQLHSGKHFDPLWPTANSFTLQDVIQGLLQVPRFGGQGHKDYVVLQHCLIGARWFRKRGKLKEARYFLWHEGEEGLGLGDMPTPIKYLEEMSAYRAIGKNVQFAVFKKAGLLGSPPPAVKELDTRMACAEAKVLLNPVPEWALDVDTSDIVIKPYKRRSDLKKNFLKEYSILFPKGIDINV